MLVSFKWDVKVDFLNQLWSNFSVTFDCLCFSSHDTPIQPFFIQAWKWCNLEVIYRKEFFIQFWRIVTRLLIELGTFNERFSDSAAVWNGLYYRWFDIITTFWYSRCWYYRILRKYNPFCHCSTWNISMYSFLKCYTLIISHFNTEIYTKWKLFFFDSLVHSWFTAMS